MGWSRFWSMLKRAHTGTFHKLSPKHLDRYVKGFAGKHNLRQLDTLAQMTAVVRRPGWEESALSCIDR